MIAVRPENNISLVYGRYDRVGIADYLAFANFDIV